MIRTTKALAVAAFALAAALGITAAQASAANFSVDFKVHNADSSVSMTRITSPLPTTVTGLDPIGEILHGGNDPSTGNAVYSDGLPGLHGSASVSLTYAKFSDQSSPCTFTIKVKNDGMLLTPYLLEFSNNGTSRCIVPGSARSANGQFTSTVYTLNWST